MGRGRYLPPVEDSEGKATDDFSVYPSTVFLSDISALNDTTFKLTQSAI